MQWKQLMGAKRDLSDKVFRNDPLRSPFETDFDRIIFSHPFRRLQDKTQVHPMPEHDFVHTRLSHSLEVSSVGRSLGKNAGSVILERHPDLRNFFSFNDFGAIVAAAALAHDIGNPPFGHSGEVAIGDYFRFHNRADEIRNRMSEEEWLDLIKFEGNAQGFRVLNNPKYHGLKLTFATLAAFSKYPRTSGVEAEKGRRSQKKYGVFQSEKFIFADIADELGLKPDDKKEFCWARHPLTFLVEAADDICYSVIDLEDGCRLGLISYAETEDLLAPIIGDKLNRKKLEAYVNMEEKVGLLRAMAISQLIAESTELFLDVENQLLDGSFDISITDEIKSKKALEIIGRESFDRIYNSKKVVETETVGFKVLPGILNVITSAVLQKLEGESTVNGYQDSVLRMIPQLNNISIESHSSDTYKALMACTDFVSDMTDSAAIALFRKLNGIDLPKG